MTKEKLLDIPVSWKEGATSKRVVHQPLGVALAAIRDGAQKGKILRMRSVVETNRGEYEKIKVHCRLLFFSASSLAVMPQQILWNTTASLLWI